MLDVAIGISLTFALFAGLVSGFNEILAQILGWRGTVLREGIVGLLEGRAETPRLFARLAVLMRPATPPADGSIAADVYDHPLVGTLSRPGDVPSYIPAATFADSLTQVLSGGNGFSALRQRLDNRSSHLGQLLGPLLDEANGDIERFKAGVESHFDAVMDRVQGWYRRRTQAAIAILAILFAVLLNIDALHVLRRLSKDTALRQRVADAAAQMDASAHVLTATTVAAPARDGANAPHANAVTDLQAAATKLDDTLASLQGLDVPIGWSFSTSCSGLRLLDGQTPGEAMLGWLLTAFAATLGAPFWFDAVSKLVSLRGTGKKPEEPPAQHAAMRTSTPPAAPTIIARGETVADLPLNDFEATRLDPLDVEALQRALGLPEARIDGIIGADLRAALRDWQRITGRSPTGRLDEATVIALLYPS